MKYDLIDNDSGQTTVHVFRCVHKTGAVLYLLSMLLDFTWNGCKCDLIASCGSRNAAQSIANLLLQEVGAGDVRRYIAYEKPGAKRCPGVEATKVCKTCETSFTAPGPYCCQACDPISKYGLAVRYEE